MKLLDAKPSLLFALGLLALTGCEDLQWRLDPLQTDGRDGGGQGLNYPALMRIGAAAHASGDLSTALSIYRRAAAVDTHAIAPFVAAGNTLMEMGDANQAIVAYNSGLARDDEDSEALRGLARAYLMTARPELAGQPLSVAYQKTPNDPKLLQLIGVADDMIGQHDEAQARYRRGLELMPGDPALSLNLALSLAITGSYPEAVATLRPVATAPSATPRERQTLALIYGLQGDMRSAEQMSRVDLDLVSVQHNLAYYDTLRRLSPDARQRAIQSLGMRTKAAADPA